MRGRATNVERWSAKMRSPKPNGNRKRIACAKNAQCRSARPARRIDARSVAYGMLRVILQANIRIRDGACIACAYPAMLSSHVSLVPRNWQKNISACPHGKQASQTGSSACNVRKRIEVDGHAAHVSKNYQCSNSHAMLQCAPVEVKMVGKRAMHAVLPSCKPLSESKRPQPQRDDCNDFGKNSGTQTFSAKLGKQLLNAKLLANESCEQWRTNPSPPPCRVKSHQPWATRSSRLLTA